MATAPPHHARRLGYHVNRTGRRLQQRLMGVVAARGYDYPVEFWPALDHLSEAGGALSQNQLAAYLSRDKGTVARLVARMEAGGYVSRASDPRDARLKRVQLTPSGKTLTAELRTHVREMMDACTDEIPPEDLETCLDVLDKVFDYFSDPA